jgi:HEPN domain-containing protein
LCKEIDGQFENLYSVDADKLTVYAVELRYPDDFYFPTIEEARESVEIAKKVRDFVVSKLGKEGKVKIDD